MLDRWHLNDVKVGDKVLEVYGGFNRYMKPVIVTKIQKIHIVIEDGTKFNKNNGRRAAASSFSTHFIQPYDEQEWQEYRAANEERQMRAVIRDFDWQKADLPLIKTVYALLTGKPKGAQ